jgi:hypothetical protein
MGEITFETFSDLDAKKFSSITILKIVWIYFDLSLVYWKSLSFVSHWGQARNSIAHASRMFADFADIGRIWGVCFVFLCRRLFISSSYWTSKQNSWHNWSRFIVTHRFLLPTTILIPFLYLLKDFLRQISILPFYGHVRAHNVLSWAFSNSIHVRRSTDAFKLFQFWTVFCSVVPQRCCLQ